MTEIHDKKPPKPVLQPSKSVPIGLYLSQESVPSDLFCEYSKDITLQYYENESPIDLKFLSKQSEFTFKHRAILIDWIHSTHKRFKLQAETLFLSINILDRYCTCRSIRISQLQLLGLTVLFLSAKYEEIYAPELNSLLKSIDCVFLKEQVATLEKDILFALDYSITKPTSLKFFIRNAELIGTRGNIYSFGLYLLELAFDHKIVAYKPSVIASAAVVLAHLLFHKDTPCRLKKKLAVDGDLKKCMQEILIVLEFARENPLRSIWDKYSKRRYHCVSSLTLL